MTEKASATASSSKQRSMPKMSLSSECTQFYGGRITPKIYLCAIKTAYSHSNGLPEQFVSSKRKLRGKLK